MKNKIIIGAIIMLLIGSIVGYSLISDNKTDNYTKNYQILEEIGRHYYENYFYISAKKTDDYVTFLSEYKTGINITLERLGKIKGLKTLDANNFKSLEKCDQKNSSITISPKKPYGVNDYEIKVDLKC